MATVIGTVTRASADTAAVNSPGDSQGNRAMFVARGASGTTIGSFRSAGEAQQAVNQQVGQVLRWVRSDLRGSIELYTGSTRV